MVIRSGAVVQTYPVPEVVTRFTAVSHGPDGTPGSFVLCGEMGPGGCYGGSCVIKSQHAVHADKTARNASGTNVDDATNGANDAVAAAAAAAAVTIHPEGWAVMMADFKGVGRPAAAALNLVDCSAAWLRQLKSNKDGGTVDDDADDNDGEDADVDLYADHRDNQLECVLDTDSSGSGEGKGGGGAAAFAVDGAGAADNVADAGAAVAAGALRDGDPEVLEQLGAALEARVISERAGMASKNPHP